ncbi:membrane traffic protein [Lithospermum erythrorhizon]|uniref:Membrane traffic protein n=1 Tax=Lithospermum erythrorhizon TaxID=34254 RepID=A0AAV3PSG0_LITER
MAQSHHSKEFLDLIKSIGESKSKSEEDNIILSEIRTLKRLLSKPDIPQRKLKELIIRLIYVQMLGHDASFGHIHAVKITHHANISLKRTGYLAVTLLLDQDHDLIILIVNTIQKYLKSDNYLVVCAALNAMCRLINDETIPAVLGQVVELLNHPKEAVRKKTVMALHRFYQRAPSSVVHLLTNFRKRLCDNDPGVMGATLCPLFDLITIDVSSYKDLVVSFVNILKQIAERRLPKSYDYHQMRLPSFSENYTCVTQIKLLKILASLGSGDKRASEQMYTIIGDIMRKCDSTSNIGNAVLYESICCATSIHPNSKLLASAADAISKFLKSDSHNLKYLGIDILGRLIKINPEIAEQHELAVIDCLEDPDDTLKRKTFELLYKMKKSSNVEVIVERMIDYMINLSDNHYKTEIASRCVELAEQFAPSNQWFIQTMNKVFEHAGDLINIKVAHNLMRLIAEGFGEDDADADSQLRSSAVESHLRIVGEPKLPSAFLQLICWVFGEYGTADGKYSATYITGKLCDVAEAHATDDTVKAYTISALMKIYTFEMAAGRKVDMLPECQSFIAELLASNSTDLQQRAYELQAVIKLDPQTVANVMPMDASCEDIEIEKNLGFLNGYVQEAFEKGAQPYIPESERSGTETAGNYRGQEHHEASTHALRFEAYELPKPVVPTISTPVTVANSNELVPVREPYYPSEVHRPTSVVSSGRDAGSAELKLRLDGVQRKWGRPTYPSTTSSTYVPDINKSHDGATLRDVVGSANPKLQDVTYNVKRQQPEVPPEKRKLAASLFGGASKSDKKAPSAATKGSKAKSHSSNKSAQHSRSNSADVITSKTASQLLPDLLDLGETSVSRMEMVDPFKQLEDLIDSDKTPAHGLVGVDVPKAPDMTYADMMSGVETPLTTSGEGLLSVASQKDMH